MTFASAYDLVGAFSVITNLRIAFVSSSTWQCCTPVSRLRSEAVLSCRLSPSANTTVLLLLLLLGSLLPAMMAMLRHLNTASFNLRTSSVCYFPIFTFLCGIVFAK